MNKLLVFLLISIFLFFQGGIVTTASSSGTRILKEITGPDQSLKRARGLPVIVSKKRYLIALMPEAIFPRLKDPVEFNLIINNPTVEPWPFSIQDLRVYSEKKDLEILEPEKVVAEARKKFSPEEYNINQEQAKALEPYVEHKMQELRENLLKTGDIPPGGTVTGLIFIEIPQGTKTLTIEFTAPGELHKFSFNIIEL